MKDPMTIFREMSMLDDKEKMINYLQNLERVPLDEEQKPHTNADRIRAMSDEELAVFVRAIIRAEDCPATGCDCDKCFFEEPCFNGSKWNGKEIEWLQQPAGEE